MDCVDKFLTSVALFIFVFFYLVWNVVQISFRVVCFIMWLHFEEFCWLFSFNEIWLNLVKITVVPVEHRYDLSFTQGELGYLNKILFQLNFLFFTLLNFCNLFFNLNCPLGWLYLNVGGRWQILIFSDCTRMHTSFEPVCLGSVRMMISMKFLLAWLATSRFLILVKVRLVWKFAASWWRHSI